MLVNSAYYIDDSRLRLAWVIPFSLLLWMALLTLFAVLLERTAPSRPELSPTEVRIVELPSTAGLQGGAAGQHPAAAAGQPPAKVMPKPKIETPRPKPHLRVRMPAVPALRVHRAKPKTQAASLLPASPLGTAKKTEQATPPSEATSTNSETSIGGVGRGETTSSGVGRGAGSGAGIGSDSSGARAIYAPQPVIPDDLREETFHAVAVARFKVTYDGQVQVALVTPTESPQLNELLLETLRKWRFFPAMKSGVAVDSQFDLRIPISVQ